MRDSHSPSRCVKGGDHFHVENFSLDLSDVGMTEFFAGVKQTRPRLLHEIAAQDPVAGGKFIFAHPV